jgi:predicted CoA-substrate-specific enzyme activase
MKVAGLDIGSRTIALVEFDGKDIINFEITDTGVNPLEKCQKLLEGRDYDNLIATGYGRHLAASHFGNNIVTEIKAYAQGAHFLYPDAKSVIDIGGQDSKAISLNANGDVLKFEMNDRCAAGTGRFLETMARVMGMPIEKFGQYALRADGISVKINSMCTVFAESEVISLIAKNEDGRRIALGLHEAISERIAGMARRVGLRQKIVFAGGVAKNPCITRLLSQKLGQELTVPEEPQIVGALGAAIIGNVKRET